MDNNKNELSWSKITGRMKQIDGNDIFTEAFLMIEHDPITAHSIDKLIGEGWKMMMREDSRGSSCSIHYKEIRLLPNIKHFMRDVSLFHEIVHAYYPTVLNDGIGGGPYRKDSYVIVEWLARKLRTDSRLLRHAVLSFNLKPYVYDFASYKAFPHKIYNPEIKPAKIAEFQKILMEPDE